MAKSENAPFRTFEFPLKVSDLARFFVLKKISTFPKMGILNFLYPFSEIFEG